ncbi:MAG: low molecular weight phosphotyrosine protein phosphatase [Bacteriovoracaceae bacterium]|nr:low molecular weight phosphotyrosine protein phosphatase [Bacteriovoracaceae bacterium]
MHKILFVCLGNICRSPAAEGVFTHLVRESGLDQNFQIDSCGITGFHAGEMADIRMRDHADRRGVELASISRKFALEDFKKFDLIIAMDNRNFKDLYELDHSKEYREKIVMFCDYCETRPEKEVPDPYYGGADGFEEVLDIVEDASKGLLKSLSV